MDIAKLASDMKDDGMSFRWSTWDMKTDSKGRQYKLLPDPENSTNKSKVN